MDKGKGSQLMRHDQTGKQEIMRQILPAGKADQAQVLELYKRQLGREFCPWDEHYPGETEIEFDLSRDALFVMKTDKGEVIAAISIDQDEAVEALDCWSAERRPGGELSRLAVRPDWQNQGIAREMLQYGMKMLAERGYRSVHFLVNRFNEKAIRSYEVFQCEVVGTCNLYGQPFLCYEKELGNH